MGIRAGFLALQRYPSGAIEVPTRKLFDLPITGAHATSVTRYIIVLSIVVVLTWIASNIIRGRIGRTWMAVRDMDIAAELIGIRLLNAKLTAFAVSSYFAGVAGALMVLCGWRCRSRKLRHQSLIPDFVHGRNCGGGSLVGSFMGATFLWVLPIMLRGAPAMFGVNIAGATIEHFTFMITGGLIIFFLIVEPHGIARLWQSANKNCGAGHSRTNSTIWTA